MLSFVLKLLYQLLIHVAAGVMFIATALRGMRDPQYRDRLPERLGFTRLQFSNSPIWIHAASVGEVQAALPLIRRLLSNLEQRPVVVTTTTPTGAARVHAVFAQQVQHAFLPYDTVGAVDRFLQRIQPHCLVVMETELWPNLLQACVTRAVPVILVSARISAKTASRYRHVRSLFAHTFPNISVAAQTLEDQQRFLALGALPERTQVAGNLKFDLEVAESILAAGREIKQSLHARPVWIVASTHAGEEEQVLQAHRQVLLHRPDALLILVPRHPQRFMQVAQLLDMQRFNYVARSGGQLPTAKHTVWLIDTVGELMSFYAVSDVAFVGGSLVPIGGHNLLEPAALGLPVLSGPFVFNAPEIANLMIAQRALHQVNTSDALAEAVTTLLDSPDQRSAVGNAAQRVVTQGRGALASVLKLIQQEARINLP